MMTNSLFAINDTIYKMGDQPEYMYILTQGALAMTTVLQVNDVNQFPTGKETWESYTTERQVQFQIRRVMQNEVFGH